MGVGVCLGVSKKLLCEHVYCRACLHSLALRSITGIISCPECRRDVPIPENFNVSSLPTPYQVNRLIEMYQENLKSAEAEATAAPQIATTCGTHKLQPLDLYCETCESLVCRDCALLSCTKKNHNHGFIDEMVKQYRCELEEKLLPALTLHKEIATALEATFTSEGELDGVKERMLQEFQTSII